VILDRFIVHVNLHGINLVWQAAEKDPYASLRSIASLQRTVSTPRLVDFSRASPVDLFEQPATKVFSATC
jgi:hypothetical protein